MKKIILALLLISFLIVPMVGLADPCAVHVTKVACEAAPGCFWHPDPDAGGPLVAKCASYAPAPEVPLFVGLGRIRDILFGLLVVAAVIFIILGAWSLMTAAGDATKLEAGRTKILWAIIAVVVALLARGIIDFVIEAIK